MADIFISYAQQDRNEARQIAARLEADGYSVWWDTGLLCDAKFRAIIMTELARARAVIVIWTQNSVQSDWVKAEAGCALADRKLIPVKSARLSYHDLPTPFDVVYTENLDAYDRISAAVVAQLAKPQALSPGPRPSGKTMRYEALAWVAAIGTALTLLNSIGPIFRLADWARYLVENWGYLAATVWNGVFSIFALKIDKNVALIMTANVFMLSLALASRRRTAAKGDTRAFDSPPTAVGLWSSIPLLFLLSVTFIITLGVDKEKTIRQEIGNDVALMIVATVFLFILLASSYRLIDRRGIWSKVAAVAVMIAVSPVAAVVSFAAVVGVSYLIDPETVRAAAPSLSTMDWDTLPIAAGALGIVFALAFAGPLVALLLADRKRLYPRIFRIFGIVALTLVLNYLSVYYPLIQEFFHAAR